MGSVNDSAQQVEEKEDAEKQTEEKNSEEQVHCLCGSSDESSFMICCDHCGVWYHGSCLQVTRTQANRIETYACPPCISKDSSLQIVYRAPKREREKSDGRDKQGKSKKIKLGTGTMEGSGSDPSSKDEGENKSGKGCNNCINCFRSTNCGKCTNCNSSVEPCLKRICLQSDWWNKQKKKQQTKDTVGQEEAVQSNVQSAKGKKERAKYITTDDETADALTQEGGLARSGSAGNGPKKTPKKAPKKKKTTTPQKRQANSNAAKNSAHSAESMEEFVFTPEQRQEIAAAVYNRTLRRSGSNKKDDPDRCMGPYCMNSARSQSKFCSEECGMNLARDRLRVILPNRVQSFWNNLAHFAEQSQRLRDAIEEQIHFYTNKIRAFVNFQEEVKKWVSIVERIETKDRADSSALETDFVLHCAVCALEFPAKFIIKHMERCFVRNEKQSCYGTPNKSQVNPYNIFCEQYNKANNTFCKRLRVLCSEHYKPPEDGTKVCGYPFAWGQSDCRSVTKTFENMESLLDKGFCHCRRKSCLQHYNWIQNAMGLIDVELLNLLIKLDEWFEKKRTLQVSETMRGNVLSLFCNKTTSGTVAENENATGGNNEAVSMPADGNECQIAANAPATNMHTDHMECGEGSTQQGL